MMQEQLQAFAQEIADTFGLSGGDHAPWGSVLYLASAAALLLLVLFLVRNHPRPTPMPPK